MRYSTCGLPAKGSTAVYINEASRRIDSAHLLALISSTANFLEPFIFTVHFSTQIRGRLSPPPPAQFYVTVDLGVDVALETAKWSPSRRAYKKSAELSPHIPRVPTNTHCAYGPYIKLMSIVFYGA